MSYLEIIGWVIAFTVTTSLFYRKGVKAGIRHALLTLNLTEEQVEILNSELKKDSYDLARETTKEILN